MRDDKPNGEPDSEREPERGPERGRAEPEAAVRGQAESEAAERARDDESAHASADGETSRDGEAPEGSGSLGEDDGNGADASIESDEGKAGETTSVGSDETPSDETPSDETPSDERADRDSGASSPDESSTRPARSRQKLLLGLVVAVSLLSLLAPISSSGIWDPHELEIADLSRRIALTLLGGGSDLALEGANNSVPTLGELARGQLPFTSIALGFRLFGLHEWAGRLPLVLWGLLGIGLTYALLARLADRTAGALGALALATMPLYFLHARTMLGDIVTMAASAGAVAGLAIACFGRPGDGESRTAQRGGWLVLGLLGCAAGFGARGALIGVVIPALGVGAAWLVLRGSLRSGGDRFGDAVGVLALIVGGVALYLGGAALLAADQQAEKFSMWVGAAIEKDRQLPTYDFVIQYLGHGLFPWSAVVPFAAGYMLRRPYGVTGPALEREAALRVTLVVVAAMGFGIYGFMAPLTGHLPFAPVFAFAGIAALALRDFDRGAPGSRVLAMGVAALAILFYKDFDNFAEKGLSAFAVDDARFPESFKEDGTRIIKYSTLGFIGLFFFCFMERQSDAGRRFDREEYLTWPRTLRSMWDGNLMFAFAAAEAGLAGFAGLRWLSERFFHWEQFDRLGPLPRAVATYGWLALPVAALVLPPLMLLARDVFRTFFGRVRVLSRALGAALAVVACGAVLSLGYYPALAAQISPKEVFESYQELAGPGEQLGLIGTGTGSASYYAGREVPTFGDVASAFNWMMSGTERRWLVIRSKDLPQMNSLYRGRTKPRRNLPVLDARSSEILLVSSKLGEGEQNDNPFDEWILTERPKPSHTVDGNFGGQLDVVGWEVTTLEGEPVQAIVPGEPYQFRIYYEVQSRISGNWETFVHIDGYQRRFNGDHKTLEGKYPFNLWLPGDYIADIHTFTMEPNFTPGTYKVFFGLFIGSRRLDVKRGKHHENRLEAGSIPIH